jgi:hypothetical protein
MLARGHVVQLKLGSNLPPPTHLNFKPTRSRGSVLKLNVPNEQRKDLAEED